MPGPAGAFAMPGAVVAAKHLAIKATAYADATTFASAAFSAMVAKWLWKTCPEWLKEDISFKHLLRTSDDVSEEDLSHLGDIVNKLDELARKSKEIDVVVPQLHAALLAYIQLTGQLKLSNLEKNKSKDREPTRDHAYRNAGEKQPVESLWITEYREALKYATWAYFKDTEVLKVKLQKRGYELLTHNLSLRPGNVSYYLALSPMDNTLILGVRGTSSLEDILTDCCGSAVPLNKQDGEDDCMGDMGIEITDLGGIIESDDGCSDKNIRCHEGILIASRRLLDEIDEHIKNWVIDAGWHLILCGHSLGAGAATVAAFLLRSRYPQLAEEDNVQLEVYAFAPPPVVDHDSALAAKAFCTSFVHNSDLIPRCSMYNLAVFLECLLRVHERLVEEDMNPTSARSTAAFFRKLSQGSSGEPLLSEVQMKEFIQNAQQKIDMRLPGHLFVPGTVYLSFNPWGNQALKEEDKEEDGISWECVETDGTAAVFRYLELDGGRMFMDHVTSTYYEVLNMDYNL
ncbi:unnamed protein product [Cylindrotheca closterium]|uniref:sn-1-specific diacylglycerol lipase n=1 Tax=Cylindrotheca closterium TaxID=2856 RepID=A0AAD2FE44_9STRA|nr:unnamed protein product [Cylindrotheca closterium]